MGAEEQSNFTNWIFNSFDVTPQGLALYRIFCALFILFFLLPSPEFYTFAGHLPSDFFAPPPGPMMIFEGWPPEIILLTLHFLLITALILLFLGWFTKIASISTGILLLILYGFIYSMGKVNHDILIAVLPVIMAFSGWGKAYSVDQVQRNKKGGAVAWPLVLLALILGFMMFTAGFPKILGGWLDTATQATQGHYFKHFFVRERQDLLAPYAQHLSAFWWEILDYATIIFEVGFLVAVINAKSIRIFVALAVLFHFGTMLILNISFLPNFLVYAAFLNWGKINHYIKRKWTSSIFGYLLSPTIIISGMIVLYVVVVISGTEYRDFLQSDWGTAGFSIVCTAVPIAAYYLTLQVSQIWKS